MTDDETLLEILEKTIYALSDLDLIKLRSLEQRIGEFAGLDLKLNRSIAGQLMQKKRLLEIVLQNCATNLEILQRLHHRNAGNQWAR